jgi:hypothetical protein
MKTKDRIAQVRASQVPEIQEFISTLDAATTRRDVYKLQDRIYSIPSIREMNHGEAWETFGSTLSDMCYAKEREINKTEKATKAALRAQEKQEKEQVTQKLNARVSDYMELPALKAALEQTTVGFYNNIVKWVSDRFYRNLPFIFDNDGNVILQKPETLYTDKYTRARYEYLKQTMYQFLGSDRKRIPDWKEKIQREAEKVAKAEVDAFKYKMALKLGAIVDKKGGAEIKVVGETVDSNSIWFKFPDGSSFEIRTQQVLSHSVLGKLFARYPSTFHHVIDHEGTKIINPSAVALQIEFGGLESFWEKMDRAIKEDREKK